jgi:hypothetical protein
VTEVLSITVVSAPNRGGTVVAAENNTVLRYTPAPQFAGVETFTYTVTDGRGAFATALVTINVGNFNSPPIPADDAYFIPQNSLNNMLEVLANDFDPDGTNVLTVSAVGVAANGGIVSIAADRVSILYTPPQPFLGTDTFTYTVDDGRGGLETAQVTITVIGWQNPENRLDVSRNGSVEALDALLVINELNAGSLIAPNGQLPTAPVNPAYYYDVNGDGFLTALDALQVINALNAGAAEGPDDPVSAAVAADGVASDPWQAWNDTFSVVLGNGPSGEADSSGGVSVGVSGDVSPDAAAASSLVDVCLAVPPRTFAVANRSTLEEASADDASLEDALSEDSLSETALSEDALDVLASDLIAARS